MTINTREMLSLVADVGGTNTRVALADGTRLRPGSIERFRNADFPSLGAVLGAYLSAQNFPDCDAACAAVAGPVEDGVAEMTNLDWRIDAITLAEAAQAEQVALLNDLQAQGHGVANIPEDRLRPVLIDGTEAVADAPKLVIGVGTGFNIAPIHKIGGRHMVMAAEAGHASLPVQTEADLDLARFAGRQHGYADIEEVLSGRGVETVYAWLDCRSDLPNGPKAAADILQGVEQATDPRAQDAASVFARIFGIVAGDLALIHLPHGGIYLSGGVSRAFGPHLAALGFRAAFLAKGRFSELMARFPVHVIEDDFAALTGCAAFLSEEAAT